MENNQGRVLQRALVTVVIMVLTSKLSQEVNAFKSEYHAADALGQLLRFQKSFLTDSGTNNGSPLQTLADVLLSPLATDSEVQEGNGTIDPCKLILHRMAEQGGNFTRCVLDHARPFRICEKCVKQYTRFTNEYTALLNDQQCSVTLLIADRMQVITAVNQVFLQTWSNGDCSNCFDFLQENFTSKEVTFNLTTETLLFQAMHTNLTECFNKSGSAADAGVNSSSVCTACVDVYRKMNDKFSQLNRESDGHMCMDLVDMMNYTRLMWSTHFNCTRPIPDVTGVIVIAAIIVILVISLYASSKCITKIRMPQLFKANRMTTQASRYGAVSSGIEVGTGISHSVLPPRQTAQRRRHSHRDHYGHNYPGASR